MSYSRFADHLILRAIARHVKQRFNVSIPSRDLIVRGVIEALADGTPMHVMRRDIRSFYECIPTNKIESLLTKDTRTSKHVKLYLKKFFQQHCHPEEVGLPRGVGLSAIAAEIFMKPFDKKVMSLDGVYRYYRFCDDILIFTVRDPVELDKALQGILPVGMSFNDDKTANFSLPHAGNKDQNTRIEYLGYKFETSGRSKDKQSRIVRVRVGDRKLNRIKTRIILSILRFHRDKDFDLLQKRMKFLSGNYMVRRNQALLKGATHVKSGIYYNYKMCGVYSFRYGTEEEAQVPDLNELKALDGFYHSIIKGPTSKHSVKLRRDLSAAEMQALSRVSFFKGFQQRMLVRFPPYQVAIIKDAWKHG